MSIEYSKMEMIKKYFHLYCYYEEVNRKVAANNLWPNGFTIYSEARIIREFVQFKKLVNLKTPPSIEDIIPFAMDAIVDYIRIITFFENFMKGSLLLNNYVVHVISEDHKTLRAAQKKRPVRADELFTSNSFENHNRDQSPTTDKTIQFSLLLRDKYQEVINLPSDLVKILTGINNERNRLHFIPMREISFTTETIDKFERIIDFVQKTAWPKIKELDNEMKSLENRGK